ncbi:MAG: glycosyltransferase family 2 protein [Oscillospiraceae bacterium]
MPNNPKISILVTIYNSEKYLPRFLDSALQQSFEDYEVVCVDNWSTDSTPEILARYKEAFPDKLFIFKTDEHGAVGKGRNTAYRCSRGDYVFWCDSDDMIQPNALTMMYEVAAENDADIVCGYANVVQMDGDEEIKYIRPSRPKETMAVSVEKAICTGCEFWVRLIKRELIEQVGLTLEDIIYDDICYIPVLQSFAKNIHFVNYPVYMWFRRSSSVSGNISEQLCRDAIRAEKHALANCNPKYAAYVQHMCTQRMSSIYLDGYWQYFDLFVDWAVEEYEWIKDNPEIQNDQTVCRYLKWAKKLSENVMPNIIYINAFEEQPTPERLEELREKVFAGGSEITVLDENNCDINENEYIKRAYEQGNYKLVGEYFVLKNMYQNGGVFIHRNIRILTSFGYLKYQNAFFALLDKKTYSDKIFGAPANSDVIFDILKTYSDSWDKKLKYMPLSERIATILYSKYNIPFDGRKRVFMDPVSVLSADTAVVSTAFGNELKKCAFEHDLSEYAQDSDYVTIKRSSLEAIMAASKKDQGKSPREKRLEKELSDFKNSNSYKIVMKIRRLGDSPVGPFLKKIFHGMLKIRSKFKRK